MPYSDKEKQKRYQRKWRRAKNLSDKIKVVEMLGGHCSECRYNKSIFALEVDHVTPIRRKQIGRDCGSELLRKIVAGQIDIKELQLLCANCHAIKTYNERILL